MAEAALRTGARGNVSRQFYFTMALTCLAIAVLGFVPTYFLPMAQGRFRAEPLVHIHGLVLFSWMTLFCAQTWLVAQGKTLAHRAWGVLGVSIATAMLLLVTAVVSMRIAQASLPGQPAGLAHHVRAFAWVSIGGISFFTGAFVLAIVKVKQPETHKRLLLLATISLLGAPIARWFMTFLAPPAGPPPALPPGLPVVGAPPVFVAIPPSLVGDILLLIAIWVDWRTRGRPHPVYLIGGALLLLLQLTEVPVSDSAAWQAIATAIGHLAG
uniref:DUF2306 domain-containing protein n=1 Tax=Caulobacter sp. (strain K31) TaxID=366602 RepID=B0T5C9_CAUSK